MSISARQIIIHVIFPLVTGLIIYVLFRKNTWLYYHLLPQGFDAFTVPQDWLSKVFVFNVPDLCWSYSLSSSLFIWKRMGNYNIKYFPALVLLFSIGAESVQYFLPSQFTFDWLDIVAAVTGFLLSYLATGKNEKV